MKTLTISSVLLLSIISIISVTPTAFADHHEVSINTGSVPLSAPGCEETNECYTPGDVTVDVGGKVIMTNTDATGIHTYTSGTVDGFVASPDGTFDSGILNAGQSFEWTPDTEGEYPYYCMLHVWMQGTITVQEAMAEEEMMEETTEEEEMMEETTEEETMMEEKEMMEMETMMVGDVDVTMSSPIQGSDDATITIIEFGDYQCPKCDQWFENEKPTIAESYIDSGKAKLYFVDFPFLGEDSDNAANASYCANDQGKFWEYHGALYNNQGGINEGWANVDALKQFGADLGLDTAEFDACVDSNKHADRVAYNKQIGTDQGVEGTPVFFIVDSDGTTERIDGPQSSAIFADVIDSMLGEPMKEAMAKSLEEDIILITTGGTPAEMTLVNGDLYVSDPEQGRIIIIDGKTNQVKGEVPAQKGIDILKYVEGTNKIYATVFETPVILVVDIDTKKVEKIIDFPESVITQWSKSDKPYGQREYVSFQTSGVGLDYDSNNKMLYVANFDGHSIEVIDTTTNEYSKTIHDILSPVHLIVDNETDTMLVLQYHENQISFVDLTNNEVVKEIDTGFAPANVALDTHHRKAYVTHHASPHVAVIDLDKQVLVKKIDVPSPTHAIGIDDTDEIIYATFMPDSPTTQAANKNQVAIIDALSDKLLATLDIESNPYNILIDTENQKGYATIIKSGIVATAYLESGEFERVEYEARVVGELDETHSVADVETSEPGGGCLIATAAYGTELAPQVQFLREIRDNTVMSTSSGAAFMSGFNQLYYSFSPTIADLEREHPMFQEAVMAFITPMISTLSIMTLAEDGNESQVFGLGASIIALNLGMYIAAPALVGYTVSKRLRK